MEVAFSKPERICAFDTCQFPDYDKYVCKVFDKTKAEQTCVCSA